jgi:hypothetical protein
MSGDTIHKIYEEELRRMEKDPESSPSILFRLIGGMFQQSEQSAADIKAQLGVMVEINQKLTEMLAEAKKTNGRVTKLEDGFHHMELAQSAIKGDVKKYVGIALGAWAVASVVIIPLVSYFVK